MIKISLQLILILCLLFLTPYSRICAIKNKYICEYCKKECKSPSFLISHIRSHTGEKPFICTHPGCDKKYAYKCNLRDHQRIHTGERPFLCNYYKCGKTFIRSNDLKDHIKIHTGEKPYKCTIIGCNQKYMQKMQLTRHTNKQHAPTNSSQPLLSFYNHQQIKTIIPLVDQSQTSQISLCHNESISTLDFLLNNNSVLPKNISFFETDENNFIS